MDTKEAARLLGISERQALHLIHQGILRAEKHGRDWWIEPDAVEAARQRKGRWKNRKEDTGKSGG